MLKPNINPIPQLNPLTLKIETPNGPNLINLNQKPLKLKPSLDFLAHQYLTATRTLISKIPNLIPLKNYFSPTLKKPKFPTLNKN